MNKYIYIFTVPALLSLIPLELIFVNPLFMQELALAGIRIPYFDSLILLAIVLFVFYIINAKKTSAIMLLFLTHFAYITFTLLFRSNAPSNYLAGLVFTHMAAIIFFLAYHLKNNYDYLEGTVSLASYMMLLNATGLIIVAYFGIGLWADHIKLIERFGGIDIRTRWSVVRGSEKIIACLASAYVGAKFIEKRSIKFVLFFIILVISQIVTSSRGGLFIVIAAFTIPFLLNAINSKNFNQKAMVFIGLFIIIMGSAIGLLTSEKSQILLENVSELTSDDSIRAKMTIAALSMWGSNIFFGIGFQDIFSLQSWDMFYLDNMRLPVHNLFLQYGVYVGIFGLIIYFVIFGLASARIGYYVKLCLSHKACYRSIRTASYLIAIFMGVSYMFLLQSMDRITLMFSWSMLGLLARSK